MALRDTIKKLNALKEQNIRLSVPRRTVFGFLFVMLLILFLLASFTSYYMTIVTVPLIGYWCYTYYRFSGVWKSFGYSVVVLVIAAVLTVIAGVLIGRPIILQMFEILCQRFM